MPTVPGRRKKEEDGGAGPSAADARTSSEFQALFQAASSDAAWQGGRGRGRGRGRAQQQFMVAFGGGMEQRKCSATGTSMLDAFPVLDEADKQIWLPRLHAFASSHLDTQNTLQVLCLAQIRNAIPTRVVRAALAASELAREGGRTAQVGAARW